MKKIFFFSLLFILFYQSPSFAAAKSLLTDPKSKSGPIPESIPESKPALTDPIDHSVFGDILEKFVSKNSGLVDYRTFKRNKESIQKLDNYVQDMLKIDGFALEPLEERKAYWINLYNALVLKDIIHHYPIQMVAEIPHFFDDKRYEMAAFKDEKVSLLDIEQKVFVERMNDPRTHLARVNGAISGPIFSQEAFRSSTINKKLEEVTISFLTDSSKNFYDGRRNMFFVSPIFLWFQEHFGRWEFSNRVFIQKRLQGLPPNFRLEYMGFDWKLNDTRNR